jgi:hypothetical protein
MTDLATVLARMLLAAHPSYDEQAILATPEGKALAALVEAALAWRTYDESDTMFWPEVERNLAAAIDAYREATR